MAVEARGAANDYVHLGRRFVSWRLPGMISSNKEALNR
jgi:hypothetical protein